MDRVIDIDVELSMSEERTLPARVVGLPVDEPDGMTKVWWYLTNLPRKQYPPELLRDLYRLRWQVELLWKNLKGRFRLDDVTAHTDHNVQLTMESAILAHFLSLVVLDAVTTTSERKRLTVGRMALPIPFAIGKLGRLVTTDDDDEALAIAELLRGAVLHGATDTNPKRTRQAAAKKLQKRQALKNQA